MGDNRIVVLIDMDCFYCQVEEKLNPDLKGQPIAVVQYNEWKGGGIIAVNYIARAKGVTRHMRGDEAKEICPNIALPKVPCLRGKANISKYREAGKDVALVLQRFTPLLERASIDEAYLDITQVVKERMKTNNQPRISPEDLPNTFVLTYPNVDTFINDVYKIKTLEDDFVNLNQEYALELLVGAVVVSEIRAAVFEATGYQCSAGIAHNKIMAKLVCGMNKPNKQTLLPLHGIETLFETLSVNKIKSLGGKFGTAVCETLKISKMNELIKFSEKELQKHFDEKNGSWLYNIARGIDTEPVTPRFTSKNIGCCKKFAGKSAISNLATLAHWLGELGDEIEERLKTDSLENNRYPTQVVVSFTKQLSNGKDVSCSRSTNIKKGNSLCGKAFAEHSLNMIKKDSKPFFAVENIETSDPEVAVLSHPIKYLGISVGKFEETNNFSKGRNISHFFAQVNSTENDENSQDNILKERRENDLATSSTLKSVQEDAEIQNNKSCATNLTTQESFFMRYFKSAEKSDDSKQITNTESENPQEKKSPPREILDLHEASNDHCLESKIQNKICAQQLDEECCSDDSECTIDLEISRSKQLVCEEPSVNLPERPSITRNFFTHPRDDDIAEEITDGGSPVDFILCQECNKNIISTEYGVHSDYHVALSLRLEDRRSIQKPIVKSAAVFQELSKKKKKSSPKDKNSSITAFFGKSTNIEEDGAPKEQCFECGKLIKLTDFSEHLDYHEAKKLSIEINRASFIHSGENSAGKRKRNSKEDTKNKKENKLISNFFVEKNI